MYEDGRGVEKDLLTVVTLLKESAAQGQAEEAKNALVVLHEEAKLDVGQDMNNFKILKEKKRTWN